METLIQPPATTAAGTGTVWTIDPRISSIGFSVKHMVVATVQGHFRDFRGTIRFDGNRPHEASVEVHIDAGSIDTGIAQRDAHLRSADFFDVAAYPAITFRGSRVEPVSPVGGDRWRVAGDLTMHGVTRPVELAVRQTGGGPNPWEADVISFVATARLNRKEFGLGLNLAVEKSELVISDEVKIAIEIQARNSSPRGW